MKNKCYDNVLIRLKRSILFTSLLIAGIGKGSFAQVGLTASAGTATGSFTTLNAAFAAINAGTHQGVIAITITGNTTEPATPTPLLQSSGASYTSISIKPSGGNWTIGGAAAPITGRALIELNGADNVTIDGDDPGTSGVRNLTFQQNPVSTNNVGVVRFASSATTDGATFNTLRNCNIIGSRISAGSSTTNYGVYSGTAGTASASTSGQSDNNDNLTIENDSIARCYWGIYCAGTAANYMDNLIVRNNVIGSAVSGNGVANRGIYIQNTQAVTVPGATVAIVQGNDIQMTASTGGAGTCMGMEIANGNAGALIRGNNVHDITNPGLAAGAYGIGISGATQNASVTIYNNFVRDVSNNTSFGVALGNTAAAYGIVLTAGAANLRVYYNSVNLNAPNIAPMGNAEVTCAFAVITTAAGVTNLDIRNNIFSNTQIAPLVGDKRYGIYLAGTIAAIGTINNNDYYSSGTGSGPFILGNFNGTDKTTLSAWQASTGQDGSSGSFNPNFTSTIDLHIPAALSQLESGAVVIAGITTDFDGQARPGPAGSVNGGGTFPDIGADEFDGIPADLTPPTINYTILGPTCTTTDRTLTATISDASGIPVSGSFQPRIYYRKNAGSYFSSQGVLSSGTATNGTWTFTIVVADIGGVTIGDQVFYYVIAQDVAGTPNITSNPAGAIATNVNTVSSPPPTPNNFFVQGALGGTFNVGISQTYPTLTSAVNAYNGSCLTGPVTFILTDASYPSETFPITITSNAYTSTVNTLTIQPNTGVAVSISGTSTAAIIKINGGDYVTIDGLNTGGSSLTLTNNDVSLTSTVMWVGSASASDGATNNAVRNCILIGNASTTTFAGVFAGSGTTVGAAGTAETPNNQLTIQGCSFTKTRYGIYANGNAITSDANWSFTQNTLGSTLATDKLSASAIILFNAQNFTVNNNIINGVASATTTTASGIGVFGNILNGTIYNNKISDIKNSNNGAAQGSNGMQLSASNTGANVTVYNNFIWDVASFGSASTSATSNGWGILFTGGGGYNVYFNTIYLSTDQTFATGITAAINITNGVNTTNAINLRNNILVNTQTVGAQRYAIICAGAFGATTFTDINYNDYFFSGPNLGTLSGAKVDLAAWQAATSKDANSQSVNPSFVSTVNLHLITSSSTLDNSGVSIAGITTDIDGDTRPATPDMGADEFTFANNNCTGTPIPGNIPTSLTLCPLQTTTLNVTGYTQGVLGITFQWEESDDNGGTDPWANAVGGSGSTTIAYTIPGSLNNIYYRCKVTCPFSSLFDYTNVCTITVTPFTIPEDFSSVTFPPGCWTRNDPTYIFRASSSAYGSGTGSAEFNFYSATYQVNLDLTTPAFTPFPSGYLLYFDHAYATYSGEIDSLVILYSTNAGSSYNTLIVYQGGTSGPLNTGGVVGSLTQFVPTSAQWASKLVALPAGTNRIIFRGKGNFGNNLYIDNINFLPPMACDAPVTPTVSSISTTSADISWGCTGCTGSYQLDYGTNGHTAGTGTLISNVTSPYTLNPPLTPNTAYTVYIRQNCGVYGFSNWSNALDFTTLCAYPQPQAGSNAPVCEGNPLSLNSINAASGQTTGNSYAWSGPSFTSTLQNPSVTGSATPSQSGTYTVTITNSFGCTASIGTLVAVNPNPDGTAAVTGVSCVGLCDGGVVITPTAGQSPFIFTDGVTVNTDGIFTNAYCEGPASVDIFDDNGCTATIPFSVGHISSAPVTLNVAFPTVPAYACSGNSIAATTNAVNLATTYTWDGPAGTTFNTGGNPYVSSVPSVTVNYGPPNGSGYNICVQAGNGCGSTNRRCSFVRGTVNVPGVITPANNRTTECASTSAGYSIAAVGGATGYTWSMTGNATVVGSGTSATVNFGAGWTGGTLSVTANTPCYSSAPRSLALSNATATPGAISGSATACPGSGVTYSVPVATGAATYNWVLPANTTGSSSSNSILVNFLTGFSFGDIKVSITSICGITSIQKIKTVASGLPAVPAGISGNLSGLCGQTTTYNCPSVAGASSYTWTTPGTINSGQGSTSINASFASFVSGNVCVTANNSCGSGAPRCVPITGKPVAPTVITYSPNPICANQSGVDLQVAPVFGTTGYAWIFPAGVTPVLDLGNEQIVNWGATGGTVTVTVSNACGNSSKNQLISLGCREIAPEEVTVNSDVAVYPNPAHDKVTVQFNATEKTGYVLSLLDLSGRVLSTANATAQKGINTSEMDLSTLAKGVYIIEVKSDLLNKQIRIVTE